ncbi:MAG TPA: YchJ family metal-binding protein, partial [Verrucomicrobiae bacterium]|nr:YchJ family metal-binding protein [Verrucomicrobiae bacterium]
MESCPCGSAAPYAECCEPVIRGTAPAETAERLMRARYTAHVKVETGFIHDSLHPAHRGGYDADATREWAE